MTNENVKVIKENYDRLWMFLHAPPPPHPQPPTPLLHMQILVLFNICLVVGLAVDYVVHLANGYYMSHARDRKRRLRHALQRKGISVLSGACTLLGASAFILFAQVQFSYQVKCVLEYIL